MELLGSESWSWRYSLLGVTLACAEETLQDRGSYELWLQARSHECGMLRGSDYEDIQSMDCYS